MFRLEETLRLSAAALCARSYRGAAARSLLSSVTPRRHSVAFKLAASDPTLDQFSALSQAISQSEPPTRDSLTKLSSAGREAAQTPGPDGVTVVHLLQTAGRGRRSVPASSYYQSRWKHHVTV